jgi:hypothetical protein
LKNSIILSQRLRNQELSSPALTSVRDVVRRLGAVQAQDFAGAKWALGLRTSGVTNDRVHEAYNRGEIIRTHLLRPTWHFVVPEDLRWLLEFTGPRVNARTAPNYRRFELDAPFFKRSHRAITKALKGGIHLTRAELKTALNRAGVETGDPVRLAHIMLRAELDGVVCSGGLKGKQFTYALLEERVPAAKTLTSEESLAELTRRYFSSHGPAAVPDFVWWSGLTVNEARRGIAMIERELDKFTAAETVYWSGAAAVAPAKPPLRSAHLLPPFDEYTVAYKYRELLFDSNGASGELTSSDALGPAVIVDGKIAGTWKAALNKGSLAITINPSRDLKKRDRLLIRDAAERYAAFVGNKSHLFLINSG